MTDLLGYDIHRYKAQATLFATRPARIGLMNLELTGPRPQVIQINIWRNHSFEPIETLIGPYAAFGRWQGNFKYSDYDDSLAFSNRLPAQIEILWLDFSRYHHSTSFEPWLEWLTGRVKCLRGATSAPILLVSWTDSPVHSAAVQAALAAITAAFFCDLGELCAEAGVNLLDPRVSQVTGSPVGPSAQAVIARKLACHWIPAAVLPPIKAIALDLDNTLHAGVLGEDGVDGVLLGPGHRDLQNFLVGLRQRGIFLALVSRNNYADVENLFTCRGDYPLRWADFSATEISWGEKADALRRVAEALRIATDAIVFVDDNPGELASVAAQLPHLHTVFAGDDPGVTLRALEYYPGCWRWKIEAADGLRIADLEVNAEREKLLAEHSDLTAYYRSLNVTLNLRFDPADQVSRLADLCRKTNQFNLALRRLNEAELVDRLERSDACVASVQLSDRLSDSGVVAVVVGHRQGDSLLIEELCISCRALGRKLEDTMVLEAIRRMPILAGCRTLAFQVDHGPRNHPALEWLARLLGLPDLPEPGLYQIPVQSFLATEPAEGVNISEESR
jgi:FkbH-like protein